MSDDTIYAIIDIDLLLSETQSAIHSSNTDTAIKKLRQARSIIAEFQEERNTEFRSQISMNLINRLK
jgi:hypothetical protein